MSAPRVAEAAHAWRAFFETLTPDNVGAITDLTTADVRFSDPFNDTTGPKALMAVFRHMFLSIDRPRFAIDALALDGERALYRWTFTGRLRRWGTPMVIKGMSEVRFAPDGRVIAHTDHWDAASQVLARLPVVGRAVRVLLRCLAAKS